MKIVTTEYQKELAKKPTRLEILREINKREGFEYNDELKDEYIRLVKGNEGEKILETYLTDYGSKNWVIIKNLWLDFNTTFEIDTLLITQAGLYPFEIKNYSGSLEFVDNQWFRYGKKIAHNAISQTQKVATHLQHIIQKLPNTPKLTGVLAFVGEDNEVKINDGITDIKILMRNQLKDYIWEITRDERNFLGYPPDVEALLKVITAYESQNKFVQEKITEKVKNSVKSGVCCRRCGDFNIRTEKSMVICLCGLHEPKEQAIVRTICEYGVIHHERDITTKELTHFFNGYISRGTVLQYLNEYFEKVGNFRNAKYNTSSLPFERLYHKFGFKSKSYLLLKN